MMLPFSIMLNPTADLTDTTLNPVTTFKHKMTLTHHHTQCKMTTHCKSSVGRSNPFRQGDNTPQLKAVFLRLSFLKPTFCRLSNIMMVLFGQSLGLVSPCRGITTPFNTVANIVVNMRDGYPTLRQGIYRMKTQDVIPQDVYLNIVAQSRNDLHLIAFMALYLENECADNKISELDAIGYIYRQVKINKEFLLDGVAA